MADYNYAGLDKQGTVAEEPGFNYEGLDKPSEFNYSNIGKQDSPTSLVFDLPEIRRAPTDVYARIEPTPEAVEIKQYDLFTKDLLKGVYGEQGLKDIQDSQRKINIFMQKAPKIGLGFVSPLAALAFETYDQGKSLLVSHLKKEKYSPFEERLFHELLPADTPTPVKIAASVGEALIDVALVAGAVNLAKQGLLTGSIKEIGSKLEAAGYGKDKVTIPKEAIRQAAKGTTLEAEAERFLKAKQTQLTPLRKQVTPGGLAPKEAGMTGLTVPPRRPKADVIKDIAKITGLAKQRIQEASIKSPELLGLKPTETDWLTQEEFNKLESLKLELPRAGELPPGAIDFEPTDAEKYSHYLAQQQTQSEYVHQGFMNELGGYLAPELVVSLPQKPIIENINAFKELLGKEFIRFYGLTPEAKQAFINLRESAELRQADIVDFITKNINISPKDARYLTYALENERKYPIPGNLKAQAQVIRQAFDSIFKALESRKLLSEKFPQSHINAALEDIADEEETIKTLKSLEAIQRHRDKIQDLRNKVEVLKTLNYVPHKYKPFMESIAVNLFREGRVSGKLLSAVSKLKGRKIASLDDAKALGLIPEEDIRLLLGGYLDYSLKKMAIFDFIEKLKANKDIVLPEKKAPDDWKKIGISQLDGHRVHPYLASALKQYAFSPPEKGLISGAYDSLNRLGKTLLFYQPFIMVLNDLSQSYLAGAVANTNYPKYLWQGIRDFTHKTAFYRDCVKAGLFSSPWNTSPPIEQQISLAIESMQTKYPWVKQIVKTAMNPARLYSEISKITWGLDRIQRLATVKYFLAKGLPFQKAVDRTQLFMVDYTFIPDQLRTGMNRALLVGTYRSQMGRLYANFVKHPIRNKSAIARLIAFHAAIAIWATMNGYKMENLYRWVKKLDKPIEKPDGTVLTEQVIVGAGPLFEYHKIFGRTFAKSLYLNLARVPYLAYSLSKNRDWKGDPVFDNALPLPDKARQMVWYVIRNFLAPIEGFDRLSNEEQTAFQKLANLLAVPVYKRQDSIHYHLGQVRRIQGDLKDYMRRHPKANEAEIQRVYNEAQKRMDAVMRKIAESEKQ